MNPLLLIALLGGALVAFGRRSSGSSEEDDANALAALVSYLESGGRDPAEISKILTKLSRDTDLLERAYTALATFAPALLTNPVIAAAFALLSPETRQELVDTVEGLIDTAGGLVGDVADLVFGEDGILYDLGVGWAELFLGRGAVRSNDYICLPFPVPQTETMSVAGSFDADGPVDAEGIARTVERARELFPELEDTLNGLPAGPFGWPFHRSFEHQLAFGLLLWNGDVFGAWGVTTVWKRGNRDRTTRATPGYDVSWWPVGWSPRVIESHRSGQWISRPDGCTGAAVVRLTDLQNAPSWRDWEAYGRDARLFLGNEWREGARVMVNEDLQAWLEERVMRRNARTTVPRGSIAFEVGPPGPVPRASFAFERGSQPAPSFVGDRVVQIIDQNGQVIGPSGGGGIA